MLQAIKTQCHYQGPGRMNPAYIGGYDMLRTTDDIDDPDYWNYSGETTVYDAAYNQGQGGYRTFNDLLAISKGALQKNCDATVTLDIKAKPLLFEYYPPHSLDIIFVLDVTASMMTSGSHKMVQAKRALISAINMLWGLNRDTVVTIIPYGRDAMVPLPTKGLSFDYLGTMFTWRRSSGSGNLIGQLLGYRNQSFVSDADMQAFIQKSTPLDADVQLSLYNYYKYYKIKFSDIYNDDGTPKPDTVLTTYIQDIYNANPAKYTDNFLDSVAKGIPLTPTQLSYSMNDSGYENNTILDNLVWAIPYSEDTNTEAGLTAALKFLTTPGFMQSDDIKRRGVFLITDGQSNRSFNPSYRDVYVHPTNTDSDFLPDQAGEYWKYFMLLQQTYMYLASEIGNRSATYNELVEAMQRAASVAERIKDTSNGNAQMLILGIDIDAQLPGPYTKEDIISIMQTMASAPTYLKEASENDPFPDINEQLLKLFTTVLQLEAGLKAVVIDTINTALFRYVSGSIKITGERDGLKLKTKSEPDITDPTDPNYTVYQKQPLLPDVSDANVMDGVITVDLGIIPFSFMSPESVSVVHISYDIEAIGSAYGDHLHTDNDEQTYVRHEEPNHYQADSSVVVYDNPAKQLAFHTPIISCNAAVTIRKLVGTDPNNRMYKSVSVKACSEVYYKVIIENHTDAALTFAELFDVHGVETIEEALDSDNKRILARNFTVPANSASAFEYSMQVKCEETNRDFAVLMTNGSYLYDEAVVYVSDTTTKYTVEYINYKNCQRLHPPKKVCDVDVCSSINAYCEVIPIPGYEFIMAVPKSLDFCSCKCSKKTIKLYYVPESQYKYDEPECCELIDCNKCKH